MSNPNCYRPYIGRFAPSPSGPLHQGSLLTALASWLDARANNGIWLLRIEDIDEPRSQVGAADSICTTLQHFGLHWDNQITQQSLRKSLYQDALDTLQQQQKLYACSCSRKQLNTHPEFVQSGIYPGICRSKKHLIHQPDCAIRIHVPDTTIKLHDAIQGSYQQHLAQDVGDFILKRRDGYFAYQLAVVVDDAEQGITHSIRGLDILDSTPRQIFLQQQLNYPSIEYAHLPLIMNAQGQKLSKQNKAPAIDLNNASELLIDSLQKLRQNPPLELRKESPESILQWAIAHWRLNAIPQQIEPIE